MNKYAEYKEAYKALILDSLIKDAKFEKAIDPAKAAWKKGFGEFRKMRNDFDNMGGQDVNPVAWIASRLISSPFEAGMNTLTAGKIASEAGDISTRKVLDALYQAGNKKVTAPSGSYKTPTPDLIRRKIKDLLPNDMSEDSNKSIKKLLNMLGTREKRVERESSSKINNLETLRNILGGTTALGAVGTGYGLYND